MDKGSHSYYLLAGIAAGSIALGTAAATPLFPASVAVTVLADRYAVGDSGFHSLQALESHLKGIKPQALRVQACGPSTIQRWKAVVHRFRDLPIEPRVLYPNERECSPARLLAIRAASRADQPAADMDDAEVNRYWQELIP